MATIHLSWAPSPESELVTGYQVFQVPAEGPAMPIGPTTKETFLDIVDPAPGVYTFAVKAINFGGVSPLGPVAQTPGVPAAPSAPVISIV